MIRLPYISCALVLAIGACGSRSPVAAQARGTAAIPDISEPAPTATGLPHGPTSPARAARVGVAAKIPAALQGRWALAPRDCSANPARTPTLLVITPGELRFNEGRAVLTNDLESGARSLSGTFAFTSGGRGWTKFEALSLDNHRLVRTESDPAASFSYAKCS